MLFYLPPMLLSATRMEPSLVQDLDSQVAPLGRTRKPHKPKKTLRAQIALNDQVSFQFQYNRQGSLNDNQSAQVTYDHIVHPDLQISIQSPSYQWGTLGSSRGQGWNDVSISATYQFAKGGGPGEWNKPGQSVIVGSSLPSGSKSLTSGAIQPSLTYAASWAASKDASIDLNLGAAYQANGGSSFTQLTGSLSYEVTLNSKWSGFVELNSQLNSPHKAPNQNSGQVGVTYQPSPRASYSLSLQQNFYKPFPGYQITAGFTLYLP